MNARTTINKFRRQPPPSQLNSTQRKRIVRLQARLEEAEAITTAIELMQIERWFPAELRKALIRFNRKIKKGG